MTVDEIVRGESKTVEFKSMLPKDSERYIKTIVAFANSQGGQLIIGVDDKTREVVGVDEDILFPLMDSISNAVSDSCTPQIVPNVEPQTVDGKTVIVVAVAPGPNRPYYLKSRGKEGLTYEELMSGHSKLRNRVIANVLGQMGMVESWGTGIKRIMKAAENYGLPTPEFLVFDDMFRVNLFRNPLLIDEQKKGGEASEEHRGSIGETSKKHRRNIGETSEKACDIGGKKLNDTQRKILALLSEDAGLPAAEMAERIGITRRNIEANIKKLKDQGILVRHGSPKNGYWEIVG